MGCGSSKDVVTANPPVTKPKEETNAPSEVSSATAKSVSVAATATIATVSTTEVPAVATSNGQVNEASAATPSTPIARKAEAFDVKMEAPLSASRPSRLTALEKKPLTVEELNMKQKAADDRRLAQQVEQVAKIVSHTDRVDTVAAAAAAGEEPSKRKFGEEEISEQRKEEISLKLEAKASSSRGRHRAAIEAASKLNADVADG